MRQCFVAVVVIFLGVASPVYSQGRSGPPVPRSTRSTANSIEPARYPLELVLPRAAESSPSPDDESPAISGGHRIFYAYPNLEYNIRAVVLGGSYPFQFRLTDAPAGMTIDANTGEIRWPNPVGSRVRPMITVIDAEGTERSSSWEIQIGAAPFRFVDANHGSDSANGSRETPWKTLAAIKANSSPCSLVYFRAGTYDTSALQPTGDEESGWKRAEFNGRVHPVQWIAYPGEKPVIDNGYRNDSNRGWFIRLQGSGSHPVYLDGLEFVKARHIGLQFVSGVGDFAVFRRLAFSQIQEAINGANSAAIMTLTNPQRPSWYSAFQDLDFHHNACGGIKQYSQRKLLWEDCQFRDSGIGPDLKSDISRFEVRHCDFRDNSEARAGLFGNMHPARGRDITGEIRFNRMICRHPGQLAMEVNQDGLANEIHLYRNTFIGLVRVRNTDSADGPFHFERNVIVNTVNGSERIEFEGVNDPGRIVARDNLTASPSDQIVDPDGKLRGKLRSLVGQRGHEVPPAR
jgi:hypothetical protein